MCVYIGLFNIASVVSNLTVFVVFKHHSSLMFSLVELEEVSAAVWHKQLQHF